jgi:hypothetical protein
MPFNRNFHLLIENNEDLYGPFWIYTTLIFIVSVCGNLSAYLNMQNKEDFRYNLQFIPNAALFVKVNLI